MLPARRQKPSSGIERAPRREWPRHRRFVRSHECSIAGRAGHVCEGPVVFAHVRSSMNGGTGLKPSDAFAVSLCDAAHRLQHQIGEPAFERRFGINLLALAAEFAAKSPDQLMKEAMKNG